MVPRMVPLPKPPATRGEFDEADVGDTSPPLLPGGPTGADKVHPAAGEVGATSSRGGNDDDDGGGGACSGYAWLAGHPVGGSGI